MGLKRKASINVFFQISIPVFCILLLMTVCRLSYAENIFVISAQQAELLSTWLEGSLAKERTHHCKLDEITTRKQTATVLITCDKSLGFSLDIKHKVSETGCDFEIGQSCFIVKPKNEAAIQILGTLSREKMPEIWSEATMKTSKQIIQKDIQKDVQKTIGTGSDDSISWPVFPILVMLILVLAGMLLWRVRSRIVAMIQKYRDGLPSAKKIVRRGIEERDTGWWHLSATSTVVSLLIIGSLVLWGYLSQDQDYMLPDFFSPYAVLLVSLVLLIGLVKRRVVRLNLLWILVILPSFLILIAEVCFWYPESTLSNRIHITDDVILRYQYAPSENPSDKEINSKGLNDQEYEIPKPDGVFRIVILGDSVPNDGSIKNLFHTLLEDNLNRSGHSEFPGINRLDVINVSCEGYNTVQEIRLFEKVGLDYQPDLVILAYVLNDPFLQNGAYRRLGNSYFMFQLVSFGAYALDKMGIGWMNSVFLKMNSTYSFELIVRLSFERLRLLSKIHHFRTAVAVVPLMTNFENHAFVPIYDKIARMAEEQEFDSIDFFSEFKKYPLEELEKESIDLTHPNAKGHQIMADVLEAYVRNLGLSVSDSHP